MTASKVMVFLTSQRSVNTRQGLQNIRSRVYSLENRRLPKVVVAVMKERWG